MKTIILTSSILITLDSQCKCGLMIILFVIIIIIILIILVWVNYYLRGDIR